MPPTKLSGQLLKTGSNNAVQATSSFALTASFALNAGGSGFPYTGNAVITGSLLVSGSGITGSMDIERYQLNSTVIGNASGSMSINLTNGNYFLATSSASTIWSFTDTPSERAVGFVLSLVSGGNVSQVWPTSVTWPSGITPALTSDGRDTLTFITDNGGSTWRGVLSIKDSK